MKNLILLLLISFLIGEGFAQHKTMTVYYSGGTTDVVNLTNTDSIVIFICGASKVNYGGKDYNTVLIGSQCWFKENLDVGTMISGGTNQTNNTTIEKYCYNNNPANCTTYGGLYQWDEAMQYMTLEGAKGICPDGWHVPTYTEFQTLATTVGNDGKSLKKIGEGNGTNTSGFSALLSGGYSLTLGFIDLGYIGYFWSSTEYSETWTHYMHLYSNTVIVHFGVDIKVDGLSVRCIKD